MKVRQLSLFQFKNHPQFSLDFDAEITCITGRNGSGKTNILDAVYLLCTCKSYFNPTDFQLIQHGENVCSIQGKFTGQNEIDLHMLIESGKKKKLKKNDKYYEKLSEHLGLIVSVFISPDDIELVQGHSDVRRKFLDICISQTDRLYLQNLTEYNKILERRNAQLKTFARHKHFDEIILESLDHQLVPAGEYIYQKRAEVLETLNKSFNKFYKMISSGTEDVKFSYKSDLHGTGFSALLKENTDEDLRLERTSRGPHRDDIEFEIDGHPLKRFGSQGQSKSFIISLKLAQYEFFTKELKTQPILLLDDLFEKIDEERAQKLIDLLQTDEFGQILLTDTHPERVKKHFENVNKKINFVVLK